MFISDKDLKSKAKPKATATAKSNQQEMHSVVEQARIEREERQRQRERNQAALKIQKIYRGRFYSRAFASQLRKEFDKKVEDIKKLCNILKISKGIKFSPPGDVSLHLLRLLCFGRHIDNDDTSRILSFCRDILIPNLLSTDIEKSLAPALVRHLGFTVLMSKLVSLIFHALDKMSQRKVPVSENYSCTLYALSLLCGKNEGQQFGLKSPRPIEKTFSIIRCTMFERCCLFDSMRGYLVNLGHPFLNIFEEEEYQSLLASRRTREISETVDLALQFCLFILSADESEFDKRILSFSGKLMSVPFLTVFLSETTLKNIVKSEHFVSMLRVLSHKALSLPPTERSVFQSGHFLLGNIASFIVHFNLSRDIQYDVNGLDGVFDIFITSVSSLLSRYYIPNVFQGSVGVLWSRNGAVLTASGVPVSLKEQILSLVNRDQLVSIYSRYFDLTFPVVRLKTEEEDLKNISQALSSSSVEVARQAIADSVESSRSWGISTWFNKLNASIASAFTFTTSQSSSASSRADAPPSDVSSTTTVKNEAVLAMTEANRKSIISIWALILPQAVSASTESVSWKSVSSLVFSTSIIKKLWNISSSISISSLERKFDPAQHLNFGESSSIFVLLSTFLKIYLITCDDSEIYDAGKPLELVQFLPLIRYLKIVLYRSLFYDIEMIREPKMASSTDPMDLTQLMDDTVLKMFRYNGLKSIASVLDNLHTRWARRPFSSSNLWTVAEADTSRVLKELRELTPFSQTLLRIMPWSISFHQRMQLFREFVNTERLSIQTDSRGNMIRIRRSRILEDGKSALDKIGHSMKDRIIVRYINDFGEEEAGIDAGGLFKDFLTDLSARVFDPSFGLFIETSNKLTYPNPAATKIYDSYELDSMFSFLGRVLGKALFENIVIQPQLTHFFLAFMHGRYNFMNLINDLATLDPELYKNLLFLKSYDGDISDLDLYFSITDNSFGLQTEVDLIPNGQRRRVTPGNKHRYIQCVAKYYLHDRIQKQAAAFFHGLYQVIQPELLGMFCAPELQVLLSGALTGITMEDLRSNCSYAGGYHALDSRIRWFWDCVKDMTERERGLLLKFVTSCERPPSLGLANLDPPFTIQKIDASDDSRLPTASTCFNTLKLPTYSSSKALKTKLLAAIHSGAGFDLS